MAEADSRFAKMAARKIAEEAEQASAEAEDVDILRKNNTYVSTQTPNEGYNEVDGKPRNRSRTDLTKRGAASTITQLEGDGMNAVHEQLMQPAQKEPTTRKTIDLPDSLNDRLSEYCHAYKIKVEKKLWITLLDQFLTAQGY